MAQIVNLVVAFSFFPQNFGRWLGPTNAILPFYDYGLSGGDSQRCGDTETLPAEIEKL